MNIFVLNLDARLAAKDHCDKHVVKMVLESALILCSVFHLQYIEAPYKLTHKNHPCCLWARESKENFEWLLDLLNALCKEYTKRYGKKHKTEGVEEWIRANKDKLVFDKIERTPFALAMPEQFKTADPVTSYRNYYLGGKTHLLKWKTEIPAWAK